MTKNTGNQLSASSKITSSFFSSSVSSVSVGLSTFSNFFSGLSHIFPKFNLLWALIRVWALILTNHFQLGSNSSIGLNSSRGPNSSKYGNCIWSSTYSTYWSLMKSLLWTTHWYMILELKSGKSRATKDTTKFVMWDNEKHDYNFHGEAENKGGKMHIKDIRVTS